MAELPRISDHALVRWLERRHGIDMDFFRSEMAKEVGPVAGVGDLVVRVQGYRVLVRDNTVVTFVDKDRDNPLAFRAWARDREVHVAERSA